MFTQAEIVLWWRASPWGPACGVVVEQVGDILEVLEGEGTVRIHLPSFSAEHAPRVVGRVEDGGQPRWADL
jgi:hypothetical protein